MVLERGENNWVSQFAAQNKNCPLDAKIKWIKQTKLDTVLDQITIDSLLGKSLVVKSLAENPTKENPTKENPTKENPR